MEGKDPRWNGLLQEATERFAARGWNDGWDQGVGDREGISEEERLRAFPTSEDLLTAAAGVLLEEALGAQSGTLEDPSLDAAEKLRRLFRGLAAWKLRHRAFFRHLTLAAYQGPNLLLQQRLMEMMEQRMVPLTADLFRQGTEEGVLFVPEPLDAAEQILWMMRGLGPRAASVLAAPSLAGVEDFLRQIHSASRSIERILGIPEGTLGLGALFRETLHAWFDAATGPEAGRAAPRGL